jgi:hypothetical protein
MAKFKLNLTVKEKALLEHYAYGIIAAGYGSYQYNSHISIRDLITAALVGGLLVPITARIVPNSLVNKITKLTGAPAPVVTAVVDTALADANKVVAAEEKQNPTA